jgi:hypothetical protein
MAQESDLPGTTQFASLREDVGTSPPFHSEAGRILRIAIDGQSAEALKAMETNGEITKACISLVSELRAWNQAMGA